MAFATNVLVQTLLKHYRLINSAQAIYNSARPMEGVVSSSQTAPITSKTHVLKGRKAIVL